MTRTEQRPRRRDEQALADRIGRMFTDPIPLALLMALEEAERREPGRLLKDFEAFGFSELARAYWASFWRSFQEAREAAKGPPR